MNIHEATSAIDDAPDRLPSIIYNRAPHSSALMNPAVFMTFPKIHSVPRRIYLQAAPQKYYNSKRRRDRGFMNNHKRPAGRSAIRQKRRPGSLRIDPRVNRNVGYARIGGCKTAPLVLISSHPRRICGVRNVNA